MGGIVFYLMMGLLTLTFSLYKQNHTKSFFPLKTELVKIEKGKLAAIHYESNVSRQLVAIS